MLVVSGVVLYVGSAYGMYSFYKADKADPLQAAGEVLQSRTEKEETRGIYDGNAGEYDEKLKWEERWLRLPSLRKELAQQAEGRVLEVAVGTGQNLEHYDLHKCSTVVGVDFSVGMLARAKEKSDSINAASADDASRGEIRLGLADAEQLPYEDDSFDTVLQTFVLCSVENPAKVLAEVSRVTRPGGKVLLLEHGLGSWEWLNRYLHRKAPAHARSWGCWFNRDIDELLAAADLEVVSHRKKHFGTTHIIEARPVLLQKE